MQRPNQDAAAALRQRITEVPFGNELHVKKMTVWPETGSLGPG